MCKFVITIERSELFEKCTFKKVSFDFFYGNKLVHMHPSFEQSTDAQITSLNVYEAIKDINIVQTSLLKQHFLHLGFQDRTYWCRKVVDRS